MSLRIYPSGLEYDSQRDWLECRLCFRQDFRSPQAFGQHLQKGHGLHPDDRPHPWDWYANAVNYD